MTAGDAPDVEPLPEAPPLELQRAQAERLLAFWLAFVGFNVTFMPMHLTGMRGMPRRVFTYPEGLGLDTLNLVSTIGAFILAAGLGVVLWDVVRPRRRQPCSERNPWGAGTLEWVQDMPGQPWGIRSIPEIDSRYPIWDQPNLVRDIDEGRFYLPDAEAGRRETLVTSVIDARPTHCQRLPGNSFLPLVAAVTLGGFFVLGTFHIWWAAIASAALALAIIVYWLWVGTAVRPEKPRADVGLGLELPLYATGSGSLGWWGMCITMLADVTAYACIVFGYFFFWTIHDDFPPDPASGPGVLWPVVGGALVVGAWLLTVLARRWNRQDRSRAFYLGLASAMVLAALGAVALIAGPWRSGLDPTAHAYPATVWLIVLWTALHVAVGTILQLYCVARRLAGRMTAEHDIDAHVVTLYWHFTALTAAITTLVIAMFPLIT